MNAKQRRQARRRGLSLVKGFAECLADIADRADAENWSAEQIKQELRENSGYLRELLDDHA